MDKVMKFSKQSIVEFYYEEDREDVSNMTLSELRNKILEDDYFIREPEWVCERLTTLEEEAENRRVGDAEKSRAEDQVRKDRAEVHAREDNQRELQLELAKINVRTQNLFEKFNRKKHMEIEKTKKSNLNSNAKSLRYICIIDECNEKKTEILKEGKLEEQKQISLAEGKLKDELSKIHGFKSTKKIEEKSQEFSETSSSNLIEVSLEAIDSEAEFGKNRNKPEMEKPLPLSMEICEKQTVYEMVVLPLENKVNSIKVAEFEINEFASQNTEYIKNSDRHDLVERETSQEKENRDIMLPNFCNQTSNVDEDMEINTDNEGELSEIFNQETGLDKIYGNVTKGKEPAVVEIKEKSIEEELGKCSEKTGKPKRRKKFFKDKCRKYNELRNRGSLKMMAKILSVNCRTKYKSRYLKGRSLYLCIKKPFVFANKFVHEERGNRYEMPMTYFNVKLIANEGDRPKVHANHVHIFKIWLKEHWHKYLNINIGT